MVSKIFDILLGVKKTSQITEATKADAINKIVNEVAVGNINPIEAYVILDYIKNVTETALENLKSTTLEHIKTEGENIAFNVQLKLSANKDYAFKDDKDWIEINKRMSVFKDALAVRESFLKDLVNKSIEAGKETTPISYITNISITPKPLSNT
jgi:hypothetical protein